MLADQFTAAAAAARNTAAVDEIARLTWRAYAEGQLADIEAEAVSEALQARRATFVTRRTVSSSKPVLGLPRPSSPPPRSPDRQASIERRRRQAMSGVVPAKIAASFTNGRAGGPDGHCSPVSARWRRFGISRSIAQRVLELSRAA
jgi:hypothetical protein